MNVSIKHCIPVLGMVIPASHLLRMSVVCRFRRPDDCDDVGRRDKPRLVKCLTAI